MLHYDIFIHMSHCTLFIFASPTAIPCSTSPHFFLESVLCGLPGDLAGGTLLPTLGPRVTFFDYQVAQKPL